MRSPHLHFVVAMLVVGPLLAMAGVTTGGAAGPLGVGAAGAVVAVASTRAARHAHADRDLWYPLRWRMVAVTATVAVSAALLTVGSLVWLVVR